MNRFWGVAQPVEQRALVSRVGSSNLPSPARQAGSSPAAVPGQRDATGSRTGVLTVPHPVVSRRQFLAGLLASPILIPVVKHFLPPVGGWPVPLYKATERVSFGWTDSRLVSDTAWFVKPEHANGIALFNRAHPMSAAAFRAAVLPGLQKVWAETYDNYSDDYAELFGAHEQLELFNELNPDSLEEIEIGYDEAADAVGRISLLPKTQRVAVADAPRRIEGYGERDGSLFLSRLLGFTKSR